MSFELNLNLFIYLLCYTSKLVSFPQTDRDVSCLLAGSSSSSSSSVDQRRDATDNGARERWRTGLRGSERLFAHWRSSCKRHRCQTSLPTTSAFSSVLFTGFYQASFHLKSPLFQLSGNLRCRSLTRWHEKLRAACGAQK